MAAPSAKRKPRKSPSQSRSKDTVDAIVAAATRILRERGYAQTNVNRVAERAGVSVGSLYQYFPSKEALVAEVARRHSTRMIDAFQDVPEQLFDSSDFDATFAQAVRAYFEFNAARVRPKNLDLATTIVITSVEAVAKTTATRTDAEDELIEELTELIYRYIER
jgi:AcrR family transcriptional regulator